MGGRSDLPVGYLLVLGLAALAMLPVTAFGQAGPVNTGLGEGTASLATYANEEYGFSFQYPADWGEPQVDSLSYFEDKHAIDFYGEELSVYFLGTEFSSLDMFYLKDENAFPILATDEQNMAQIYATEVSICNAAVLMEHGVVCNGIEKSAESVAIIDGVKAFYLKINLDLFDGTSSYPVEFEAHYFLISNADTLIVSNTVSDPANLVSDQNPDFYETYGRPSPLAYDDFNSMVKSVKIDKTNRTINTDTSRLFEEPAAPTPPPCDIGFSLVDGECVRDQSACGAGTELVNGRCIPIRTYEPSGGGCLVATAAYGTELAPQVQQLREIRDTKLLQTESGKAFMLAFNEFYYSFSPYVADYERENPAFRQAVKASLTPMLASLSLLNHTNLDSEGSVLGYGISLVLLNVGMYFVAPALAVTQIKRMARNCKDTPSARPRTCHDTSRTE